MLMFYCFLLKRYSMITFFPYWWILALLVDVMNMLLGGLIVILFLY